MSIGGKKEQKGGEAKLQPGSACLQSVTSYGLESKANRRREYTLKKPSQPTCPDWDAESSGMWWELLKFSWFSCVLEEGPLYWDVSYWVSISGLRNSALEINCQISALLCELPCNDYT